MCSPVCPTKIIIVILRCKGTTKPEIFTSCQKQVVYWFLFLRPGIDMFCNSLTYQPINHKPINLAYPFEISAKFLSPKGAKQFR